MHEPAAASIRSPMHARSCCAAVLLTCCLSCFFFRLMGAAGFDLPDLPPLPADPLCALPMLHCTSRAELSCRAGPLIRPTPDLASTAADDESSSQLNEAAQSLECSSARDAIRVESSATGSAEHTAHTKRQASRDEHGEQWSAMHSCTASSRQPATTQSTLDSTAAL